MPDTLHGIAILENRQVEWRVDTATVPRDFETAQFAKRIAMPF